jgi:molybdopterin converting factor small subunit
MCVPTDDTIKVKVLFFGATADAAGGRSADVEMPSSATSRAAFERVLERFPGLASHRLLYSLNEEYATGREPLSDGDEIAVFTAVSGG